MRDNNMDYCVATFPTKLEQWFVKGHFAPYIIKRDYRDLITQDELRTIERILVSTPSQKPYDEVMTFYRIIKPIILERIETKGLKQFRYLRLLESIEIDFQITT